ncbi:hypothetical protein MYA_0651 [Burkholderia stabilis]|nr:hypothetical protein MYA_0651 [Burkholderia stabilis]
MRAPLPAGPMDSARHRGTHVRPPRNRAPESPCRAAATAAGTNPCDTFQRQSAKLPYRRPSAACPTVRNPP